MVSACTTAAPAAFASASGGVRKLSVSDVAARSTFPAWAGSGSPAAPVTDSVGRQVLFKISSTSSSDTGRMPSSSGYSRFGPSGSIAAEACAAARRSAGIGALNSGSLISPVAASSTRSSSCRRIRNELGTMPLAIPECWADSSTLTVTVSLTSPRRLLISHMRS